MKQELKNIKKTYKMSGRADEYVEVLKEINLTINQGDFVSVIGRSGCGKTTLLKIMGLLTTPSEGEIIINGVQVKELWKDELADLRRKKMGFVFQDYFLLDQLTALDNIILPGLLDKMNGDAAQNRVLELADYLEINEKLLKKYPRELSGGEKQRMAIARALFNDPEFILADEPTGNLDDQSKRNVEGIFKKMHDTMNKSILLVTHDIDFAKLSDTCYRIPLELNSLHASAGRLSAPNFYSLCLYLLHRFPEFLSRILRLPFCMVIQAGADIIHLIFQYTLSIVYMSHHCA